MVDAINKVGYHHPHKGPGRGFKIEQIKRMFSRFIRYIQDTRREMAHVSWPTRAQTMGFTIMVLAISVFIALYLSVFDYGFTQGLRATLEHAPRFTGQSAVQVNTTPNVETTTDGNSGATTQSVPQFTATPIVDGESN